MAKAQHKILLAGRGPGEIVPTFAGNIVKYLGVQEYPGRPVPAIRGRGSGMNGNLVGFSSTRETRFLKIHAKQTAEAPARGLRGTYREGYTLGRRRCQSVRF